MRIYKDDPRRIIIFKEKHGNQFFFIRTQAELERVALRIFTERLENGFYVDLSDNPLKWYFGNSLSEYEKAEEKIVVVKKLIQDTEDEEIVALLHESLKEKQNLFRQYKQAKRDISELKDVVKSQCGKKAWYYIVDRNDDGNYEGFDIEYIQIAEE
jgi:hypothetical protein